MTIRAVNPANDEVVGEYEETAPEEVERIVRAAHEAFLSWRDRPFTERAALMRRAAVLRERAREFARLMAVEMGKPVKEGASEVEKCASACDFYAENAARFLAQ